MRKVLAALAVLTLGLFAGQLLRAASHMEKVTLKGELLDLVCFMTSEAGKGEGAAHADCAVKCVKGGAPLGLKAEDGKVYLVLADHSNAKPYDEAKEHAGKNVEATGMHAMKGDMHVLVLSSVKAL
jgi:hypothetical protein